MAEGAKLSSWPLPQWKEFKEKCAKIIKHRYAEKINESNKQNTVNEKEPATEKLVCYTAVFSVDTQRPRRRKKTYMKMNGLLSKFQLSIDVLA